jgi:photosystem II stability/assembly factor-like uncharacterized protein
LVESKLITLLFVGTLLSNLSPVSGQSWVRTSAPSVDWTSVASSANGRKVAATVYGGRIYTSTNSGTTWTISGAPTKLWSSIASSADGKKLIAGAYEDLIYTSTNSGKSWTPTALPYAEWYSVVTSSADGNKLVCATSFPDNSGSTSFGVVYLSTNSGTTWTYSTSIGSHVWFWTSLASSADGNKLAIIAQYNVGLGTIFCSSDSGLTWRTANVPPATWLSVASSADGERLVAIATGINDGIYTSTNAGASWISNSAPAARSVASSADGRRLVAVSSSGQILSSTNSGATWTSNNAPNVSWRSVTSSADGGVRIAVGDYGIGRSLLAVPPELHLSRASGGLMLSWIVPSANFVIQRNSSLNTANWVVMTNRPVLNLTNLQNQAVLPIPTRNKFYRLRNS